MAETGNIARETPDDARLFRSCCFFCFISSFVSVQRGGRRQGLLRHDAQRSSQTHALRGGLHSRHRSHSESFQTLASHPGTSDTFFCSVSEKHYGFIAPSQNSPLWFLIVSFCRPQQKLHPVKLFKCFFHDSKATEKTVSAMSHRFLSIFFRLYNVVPNIFIWIYLKKY